MNDAILFVAVGIALLDRRKDVLTYTDIAGFICMVYGFILIGMDIFRICSQ